MPHCLKSDCQTKTCSEGTHLFVKNVPVDLNERSFERIFVHCGKIIRSFIQKRNISCEKTYGFVSFSSKEGAQRALQLNGQPPLHLEITFARPKVKSPGIKSPVEVSPKACLLPDPANGNSVFSNPSTSQQITPSKSVASEHIDKKNECRTVSLLEFGNVTENKIDYSGMPPLIVYTIQCSVCEKIGCFCCSLCKLPYCTEECQKKDWVHHKLRCHSLIVDHVSNIQKEEVKPDRKTMLAEHGLNFCTENTPSKSPKQPASLHSNPKVIANKQFTSAFRVPEIDSVANGIKSANHVFNEILQKGQVSSLAKFKASEMPSVHLNTSKTEEVVIVFIENLGEFWVLKYNDKNMLAEVEVELENLSQVKTILSSPSEQEICCSYFENKLYRCEILKVNLDGTCTVLYIDYGNTASKRVDELYHVSAKLMKYPVLAIPCNLADVAFNDAKSFDADYLELTNWMRSVIWIACVISVQENKWKVHLMNDGNSLAETLVERGYANFVNAGSCQRTVKDRCQSSCDITEASTERVFEEVPTLMSSLENGLEIKVQRTSSTKWGFYGQLLDSNVGQKFSEMQTVLQKFHSEEQNNTYSCRIHQIVAACSPKYENKWFRGYVIQAISQNFLVHYIDYGDEEEVTKICVLSSTFRDICSPLLYFDISSLSVREREYFNGIKSVSGFVRREKGVLFLEVKYNGGNTSLKILPWWQSLHYWRSQVSEKESFVGRGKSNNKYSPTVPDVFSEKKLKQSCTNEYAAGTCIQEVALSTTFRKAVKIVWINSAEQLYYQNVSSEKEVITLTNELYQYCSSETSPFIPKEGDMVCSMYELGWYRGFVKSILPDRKCVVFFVDYGNEAFVPFENVRPIQKKHSVQPDFCFAVSLYGLEKLVITEEIKHFIMNNIWELEVKDATVSPEKVRLLKKDRNLCEILMERRLLGIKKIDINSEELIGNLKQAVSIKKFLEKDISEFDNCFVRVVFGNDVNLLLQRVCDLEDLEIMSRKLNDLKSNNLPSNCTLNIGEMVCAKYTDELWYRGCIQKIEKEKTCTILFVDYGNVDKVNVNNIKILPVEYHAIPIFCKRVVLCNFTKPFSKDILHRDYFATVVDSASDPPKISFSQDACHLSKYNDDVNSLGLSKNVHGNSMNKEVCRVSYLQKVNLPMKELIKVIICFKENEKKIFVHKVSDAERLKGMQEKLQLYCNKSPECYTPAADEIIAAKCSDGDWYRGRVTEDLSPTVSCVQFIDFGNSEVVQRNMIKYLPKEFASYPIFCVPVKLLEGETISSDMLSVRALDIIDGLQAIQVEGNISLTDGSNFNEESIPKISNPDKILTNLEDLGSRVDIKMDTRDLLISKRWSMDDINTVDIPLGQSVEILVTSIISHDVIFCVPCFQQNIAEKLSNEISDHCIQDKDYYVPELGELVLAKYPEEERWLRAAICDPEESSWKVYFIDIGVVCTTKKENIRMMVDRFMKYPQLSLTCKLGGILINEENSALINLELSHKIKTPCCLSDVTIVAENEDYVINIPGFKEHLIQKGLPV